MKLHRIGLFVFLLFAWVQTAIAVEYVDLPDCDALVATDGKYRMGMVTPMNNPDLEVRLYELGMFYEDLTVCRTSWNEVLPTVTPWAAEPQLEKYIGYGFYAFGLLITLLLFTLLPRAWRRHVTLLGIIGVTVGTWGIGSISLALANTTGITQSLFFDEVILLQESQGDEKWIEVTGVWSLDRQLMTLGLEANLSMSQLRAKPEGEKLSLHATPDNQAVTEIMADDVTLKPTGSHKVVDEKVMLEVEVVQEVPEEMPVTLVNAADKSNVSGTYWVAVDEIDVGPAILEPEGKQFRVHRALNIRTSPGVQHPIIDGSPLHRGTEVEVIASPQGDWWKVRELESGHQGWVSSLWLRKSEG